MPMIRKRIRLASRSPLRGQTLCAKRRAPWSRFRGVRTAHSRTSGLSFIDMYQQDLPSSKPQRLLEYRLALVRNLARNLALCSGLHLGCGNGHHLLALVSGHERNSARSSSELSLESQSFEVGAEELNGIADQSIDLAICIGAFEHMLDKRAMLASIYQKIGARFFCPYTGCRLRLVSDDSTCVGVWNMHLSNDRILTLQESMLLDEAGFRRSRSVPWTFIPKGDVSVLVALLLIMMSSGRHARLDSFRGGLSLCGWQRREWPS